MGIIVTLPARYARTGSLDPAPFCTFLHFLAVSGRGDWARASFKQAGASGRFPGGEQEELDLVAGEQAVSSGRFLSISTPFCVPLPWLFTPPPPPPEESMSGSDVVSAARLGWP